MLFLVHSLQETVVYKKHLFLCLILHEPSFFNLIEVEKKHVAGKVLVDVLAKINIYKMSEKSLFSFFLSESILTTLRV